MAGGVILALAGFLALAAPQAAAQSLLCREGVDEPLRSVCATLGREAQWALSERAMANLGDLSPERGKLAMADIGNWAETVANVCDPPAPTTAAAPALANFRADCRSFLAESLSAYLDSPLRPHAGAHYRWRASRAAGLETLALSVMPVLEGSEYAAMERVLAALEREAARYLRDTSELANRRSGAAKPACCAQFVEVRVLIAWFDPALVSIEITRRLRARDGQESAFRYVTLYDPVRREEIETFAALFDQTKAAIDAVFAILEARFATRSAVRDYTYFTLNNLQNYVADLKRWRFDGQGLTVLFDAGDIAAHTIGAINEPIPYDAILPFIKKDGPLGRALNLK